MIYFIQAGESGPIKIGASGNLRVRRKGLQTSHYSYLKIIGVMPGSEKEEHELQNRFIRHNIRGEWFNPDSEILDFIAKNSVQGKVNTVQKLPNGEYRIIFAQPIKAALDTFLFFGTHKLRLLSDKDEPKYLYGIVGKASVIEDFFQSVGVEEQALQEFKMALSD